MFKVGVTKGTRENVKCWYLDMHGVEAVEQQQYERIQHLQR